MAKAEILLAWVGWKASLGNRSCRARSIPFNLIRLWSENMQCAQQWSNKRQISSKVQWALALARIYSRLLDVVCKAETPIFSCWGARMAWPGSKLRSSPSRHLRSTRLHIRQSQPCPSGHLAASYSLRMPVQISSTVRCAPPHSEAQNFSSAPDRALSGWSVSFAEVLLSCSPVANDGTSSGTSYHLQIRA